jgi:hypothetical protein
MKNGAISAVSTSWFSYQPGILSITSAFECFPGSAVALLCLLYHSEKQVRNSCLEERKAISVRQPT